MQLKKARCIGLSIFTFLSLVTATVMELCHMKLWADRFENYRPHYSDDVMVSEERVAQLNKLNWAKTVLSGYVIIFALILQSS